MGDFFKAITGGVVGIIFMIAAPVTYILAVVDTWSSHNSIFVKVLICLTLDAFLAMIWPITWAIWLVMHWAGNSTPISTVLGF